VVELIYTCTWQRYDKWPTVALLILVTALAICTSLALQNIVKNASSASMLVFVASSMGLIICVPIKKSEIAKIMLFTASVASLAMLGWTSSNSDYRIIPIIVALTVAMDFSMVRYFISKK